MSNKIINILVACGSGVATSTLAAGEVTKICEENNIPFTISKCSMTELQNQIPGKDVVLTTNNYRGDLPIPHMSITAFITGINEDKLREKLKTLLLEIQNG